MELSEKKRSVDPPQIAGFEFISVLGQGGFADVFEYQQQTPRRRVAIKVLLAQTYDADASARLEIEANAVAELSQHPNIVTVFGAGVATDGRPYLVMERYPSYSLGTNWRQVKHSVAKVLSIGIQLAGALETAHQAGVMHRDIKPANILVDRNERPVLGDFGISQNALNGRMDAEGFSMPWAPPEFFFSDAKTFPQSDVWGLAATLYSLLAGRAPFEIAGMDNSIKAQSARIVQDSYIPIGREDVPPQMDQVLLTAMSKNPQARFQSAASFGHALRAIQMELGLLPTALEVLRELEDIGNTQMSANVDAEVEATVFRSSESSFSSQSYPSFSAYSDSAASFSGSFASAPESSLSAPESSAPVIQEIPGFAVGDANDELAADVNSTVMAFDRNATKSTAADSAESTGSKVPKRFPAWLPKSAFIAAIVAAGLGIICGVLLGGSLAEIFGALAASPAGFDASDAAFVAAASGSAGKIWLIGLIICSLLGGYALAGSIISRRGESEASQVASQGAKSVVTVGQQLQAKWVLLIAAVAPLLVLGVSILSFVIAAGSHIS